jgi:hypothetical protein
MNNIAHSLGVQAYPAQYVADPAHLAQSGYQVGDRADGKGKPAEGEDWLSLHKVSAKPAEEKRLSFFEAVDNARERVAVLMESFREGKSPFDLDAMAKSKEEVERILAA